MVIEIIVILVKNYIVGTRIIGLDFLNIVSILKRVYLFICIFGVLKVEIE